MKVETILAKSRLVELLALGFSYPVKEKYEQFCQGLFKAALAEALAGLPDIFPGPAEAHLEGLETVGPSLEEFETEYINTFDLGPPAPPCPIMERAYHREHEPAGLLFEVSQFYSHFGLEISQDKGLPPDHVAVELDFVHFLLLKQAQAIQEGADSQPYQRAQKDFLQRHLNRWLPAMSDRLEQLSGLPFYQALARLAVQACAAAGHSAE